MFRYVSSSGSSWWYVASSSALASCSSGSSRHNRVSGYARRDSNSGQQPGPPDGDTAYGGWHEAFNYKYQAVAWPLWRARAAGGEVKCARNNEPSMSERCLKICCGDDEESFTGEARV